MHLYLFIFFNFIPLPSIAGYGIVIPTYGVTMNDVERVMTLTSSCQQYIKYECNTSKLILQRKCICDGKNQRAIFYEVTFSFLS